MLWIVAMGVVTGMRTMTAMAVLCMAAWLGYIPVHNTWAFWAGYAVTAIVFAVLAVGEYVGDTLPQTPNRTSAFPAAARLIFGSVAGAIASTSVSEPIAGGVIFGLMGAGMGTWGGFYARRALARRFGRDLPAAVLESAFALGLALAAVHALHADAAWDARRTFAMLGARF